MDGEYMSRSPMNVPTKNKRLDAGRNGARESPDSTTSRHLNTTCGESLGRLSEGRKIGRIEASTCNHVI